MKCSEAELYMMKYMDSELSENEAERLNLHIAKCSDCKEAFYLYDSILNGFEEEIVAPDYLEAKIMAEIRCISPNYVITDNRKFENFSNVLWGIFAGIFGLGIIFSIYSAQLADVIRTTESLSFLSNILPAADIVTAYTTKIGVYFTDIASQIGIQMQAIRYVFLSLLIVLVGIQVFIYRRNRVKDVA